MENIQPNFFNNLGYLSSSLSDVDLMPIRKEIQEIIDRRFELTEKSTTTLAGNIEKEYYLSQSKEYLDGLLWPFCEEYNSIFRYMRSINVLTQDVPLILDKVWVNFQEKNEFNPLHNHGGIYSFVIWIDIPYSIQDEMNHPSTRDSNNQCAGHFTFTYINVLGDIQSVNIPADMTYNNRILFFPARMMHSVNPFRTSDGLRISVSGNYKLKI